MVVEAPVLGKNRGKVEINVVTNGGCEDDFMLREELSDIVSSPIAVSQFPETTPGEQQQG